MQTTLPTWAGAPQLGPKPVLVKGFGLMKINTDRLTDMGWGSSTGTQTHAGKGVLAAKQKPWWENN